MNERDMEGIAAALLEVIEKRPFAASLTIGDVREMLAAILTTIRSGRLRPLAGGEVIENAGGDLMRLVPHATGDGFELYAMTTVGMPGHSFGFYPHYSIHKRLASGEWKRRT